MALVVLPASEHRSVMHCSCVWWCQRAVFVKWTAVLQKCPGASTLGHHSDPLTPPGQLPVPQTPFLVSAPYSRTVGIFYTVLFKDFISLFLERGEGRGNERERRIDVREKHWPVASCTCPSQGLNAGPWTQACALTGNRTGTFWFAGPCPANMSHTTQGFYAVFLLHLFHVYVCLDTQILTIVWQLRIVFSTVTRCTSLQPRTERIYPMA